MHFRKLPKGVQGFRDQNVEVVESLLHHPQWLQLLQHADCFLFPSRGEGWGLPPREAAATGLPAIATNWGGLAVELPQWGIPLNLQGMLPATFGEWDAGEVGEWAEPSLDHLVDLMLTCYENRAAAAAGGLKAAAWLAQNTPWTRTAQGVMEVMKEAIG
jgi:glycosyltransferase involved in cell wall biosynthesis